MRDAPSPRCRPGAAWFRKPADLRRWLPHRQTLEPPALEPDRPSQRLLPGRRHGCGASTRTAKAQRSYIRQLTAITSFLPLFLSSILVFLPFPFIFLSFLYSFHPSRADPAPCLRPVPSRQIVQFRPQRADPCGLRPDHPVGWVTLPAGTASSHRLLLATPGRDPRPGRYAPLRHPPRQRRYWGARGWDARARRLRPGEPDHPALKPAGLSDQRRFSPPAPGA